MLRISKPADPPVPDGTDFCESAHLESQNAAGFQQGAHFPERGRGFGKVAQEIAVVDHIISVCEFEFFKETRTNIDPERLRYTLSPFGIRLDTGDFVSGGLRLTQEIAVAASDFQ
jgi:hypothetical protein